MAIKERVVRKEYPGAITLVEVPYDCTNYPTIQELAIYLMSDLSPSVIIGGRLYTEQAKGVILTACGV